MPFALSEEFREFFLRNLQVTAGPKPDQETGFPTQYLVDGVLKFNRFLKDHAPSEDVVRKLFKSITFKKNVEDTATQTAQGLVRLATYLEAVGHRDALSTVFSNVVRPSHLPQIDTVIRASDAAVAISGKRTNLSVNFTEVTDAHAALLSYGDPLVGTGIPSGTYVVGITHVGADNNTVIMSAAATSGTATVTAVTITSTTASATVVKVVRTDGTFTRTVYVIQVPTPVIPSPIVPVSTEYTNVDAITVTSGTAIDFDFADDIPTGNYLAHVFFTYEGNNVTITEGTAQLRKDATSLGYPVRLSSNAPIAGAKMCSFTIKISITLGQMLRLHINNPAGPGDFSLGSPRVVTLEQTT